MIEAKNRQEKRSGFRVVPELVKRATVLSLGAFLFTEETIRKLLGDMKLPRDLVDSVVKQANRSKDDFIQNLSKQLAKSIESLDLAQLASELARDFTVHVNAEITFKPRPGSQRRARQVTLKTAHEIRE